MLRADAQSLLWPVSRNAAGLGSLPAGVPGAPPGAPVVAGGPQDGLSACGKHPLGLVRRAWQTHGWELGPGEHF